jgi:hypothetical protein
MLAHRLGHEVARLRGGLFTVLALGALVWVFAFIGMLGVARSVFASGSLPAGAFHARVDEPRAVPGLPAYPGAACTEYRDDVIGRERVIEIEYVIERALPEVRDHYRALLGREGWDVTDTAWVRGELIYTIESGARSGVVELEHRDGVTEIEIELSEPVAATDSLRDR